MTIDFKSLPYNQLQSACKERGLSAKGKTLELIQRLEQYELEHSKVKSVDENDDVIQTSEDSADLPVSNIKSAFSKLTLGRDLKPTVANNDTIQAEVTTQAIEPQIKAVENTSTTYQPKPGVNAQELANLSKVLVFINGIPVGEDNKIEAWKYVNEAITYFQTNDSSRVLNAELPDLQHLTYIDIQMKQAVQWRYGIDADKQTVLIHNGRERQSIDAIYPSATKNAVWSSYKLSKKAKRDDLNRKRTDFNTNSPVSQPGREENRQAMGGKAEEPIFYGLYQHLQYKNKSSVDANGKQIDRYHPEYILTTAKPVFVPYVQHIKVNDKWIISGLTKLSNSELEASKKNVAKVDKARSVVGKFSTGILGDWSIPFQLQLTSNDYLGKELGTEPRLCQLAIEKEQLNLYILDKKCTSDKLGNLVQSRTKLLTIGTIELLETPVYQWLATSPQHEKLADTLNRSINLDKLSDNIKSNYDTSAFFLTNDSLSIDNRVLASKKNIGNKLVVRSVLNAAFINPVTKSVKSDCIWLDQLRITATNKMLQANVTQIKTNVDNYINNNSNKSINKATHDVKKLCQSMRGLIRIHQSDANESDVTRLAHLMVEHLVTKLSLNKDMVIGSIQSMKADYSQYIELRDKVLTRELGHLKQTNLTTVLLGYR